MYNINMTSVNCYDWCYAKANGAIDCLRPDVAVCHTYH